MLYRVISKRKSTTDVPLDIADKAIRRAIQYARKQFPVGSRVRFKGTKSAGVVIDIITHVQHIPIKAGRPHVVLVELPDGNKLSCNISQIKRSGNVPKVHGTTDCE